MQENLISFIEFDSPLDGLRGGRLQNNSCSIWYNLDGQQKNYAVTFAQNIETERKNVKIGTLGDEICFVFTDEPGIKLNNSKNRKNILFHSKGFLEYIYPELKKIKSGKDRKVFQLKEVGKNVLMLKTA